MSDPIIERLQTEAQLAKNGGHPILARSFELAIAEIQNLRQQLPTCGVCKGRGYRESPPFREWIDDDTPTLSTIRTRCKSCAGTGRATCTAANTGG